MRINLFFARHIFNFFQLLVWIKLLFTFLSQILIYSGVMGKLSSVIYFDQDMMSSCLPSICAGVSSQLGQDLRGSVLLPDSMQISRVRARTL